jgi:hypothetical protein
MNKNERWEAGRDNKYFEGEQGKEKKRRGSVYSLVEDVWTSA